MKRALVLVLASCVAHPLVVERPDNVPPDAIPVHGRAVIRDARCGGAKTPEASATPAANLTLRLQLGHQNLAGPPAAVLQTDAAGAFEAWLSPGEYCVVLKSRSREGGRAPAVPQSAGSAPLTAECLERLALLCDGELVVGARQKEVWADLAGKSCPSSGPCATTVAKPAELAPP
jgi:hypothetical protein